jgi:hypothetical protein
MIQETVPRNSEAGRCDIRQRGRSPTALTANGSSETAAKPATTVAGAIRLFCFQLRVTLTQGTSKGGSISKKELVVKNTVDG